MGGGCMTEDALTAEQLAFKHRSGKVPFQEAYETLIETYEIPEEEALKMLFPPLGH